MLILAHRGELLDQAADKLLAATGLGSSVEKAESTSIGSWFRVTVGSVQTLMREKRLKQFPHDWFDQIIIDEAHHVLSSSYQTVLDWFPNAKVLGVTATPDRGDRRELGAYFDSIAYEYTLPRAIKDGYLCPIKAQTVPLKLDLSSVKMQSGDYSASDLGTALDPYLDQIADEMVAAGCLQRKTVVFLPLVATSKKFRGILQSKGFQAAEVNGESIDRAEVLDDFDAGHTNVLCNSMLLCLDMETEILTSRGFVGPNEIHADDLVANWNIDGTVFFEKPHEIVRRPLGLDEHMTSIDSKTINIRVTNTHRMIVSCGSKNERWKKIAADDLRNGHLLPSCGIAEPLDVKVPEPPYERLTHKRVETGELRYTDPSDLSKADCRFIGFFLAEGTRTKLRSGGIEYKVCQVRDKYPAIVDWFDRVVKSTGFDVVRKERDREEIGAVVYWSFSRGTGHSTQSRNGLFRIEPYLDHEGSDLLWGLDETQFDSLIDGFWRGDGFHGAADGDLPRSIVLRGCYRALFDKLCAIGAVRGWRCHLMTREQKNPKHNTQWELRMIKGRPLNISFKTIINQEEPSNEEVWCVRTTSKNIVTRRHGVVSVMGNTEGWDCPSVDCIVMLRPTKIRSLYAQAVGRGTRLSPETGKTELLLLDFLWHTERHELCRPAHLIAESDDVANKMTEKIQEAGYPIDLEEVEEQAASDVVADREEALAKQLAELRGRKRKLVDPLQYEMSIASEDLTNYVPAFGFEMAPVSESQKKALEKAGIFPDEIECAGKASLLLDRLSKRRSEGLATPRQIRQLEQRGFKHVGTWTFDSATNLISRIAANNWRTPSSIDPSTYNPEAGMK